MPNLTSNQHYVWQHYLRAWCVDKHVWCKRSDTLKAFPTSPRNVAAERFFYETFELTDDDLAYLERLISHSEDKRLQSSNRGWLESFQKSFVLRREISRVGMDDKKRDALKVRLREIEKTIGEAFHAKIEDRATPILNLLRRGDTSFYRDEVHCISFITYLSHQYFRTARMRNAMLAIPNPLPHDTSRTWPVESFIFATNLGASLVRQLREYKIVLLFSESAVNFVTGDQPVINLLDHKVEEVDFYYPVSPNIAIIFTANSNRYPYSERKLSRFEVESYNHKIFVKSDTQIFGNDPQYLQKLAQLPKLDVLV